MNLKPNPDNPRTITTEAFEQLKAKIQRNPDGLTANKIVHKDGIIIAGNQRWRAINDLKLELNPEWFKDVSGWTDEQIREYLVTSNISDGAWDWDALLNEYEPLELQDWGLEVPDWQDETEVEEDEAPEVSSEPPVSQLGVIYQLGRHRVMCGDSLDVESVSKLLEGGKADMVFTDPPYGVSYTGGLQNTNKGLKGNARQMINNDDIDLYEEAVSICAMFSKGAVFMFYADTVPFGLYRGIEKVKGDIVALIIWKKRGGYGALGASYKANHEPCLLWKPKGTNLNFVGSTTENRIWEIDKEGLNKLHPTQKPVSVPARAIKNHSANTVLDLFLGSGSTLIACEQTDRTCYGMELDPKYVDVIRKRYAKFTSPDDTLPENWEELTPPVV